MNLDFIVEIEEEETSPNRPHQKEYGRGLKRKRDWKKARRKEEIVKNVHMLPVEAMPPHHWYSKNKIHCSCPLCSSKRKDGHIPIYERKKIDRMDNMVAELRYGEESD